MARWRMKLSVVGVATGLVACAATVDDPIVERTWTDPCYHPSVPDHRACEDAAAQDVVLDGPAGPIVLDD